jgi:hypothetical protein
MAINKERVEARKKCPFICREGRGSDKKTSQFEITT